jgi:hypothetical protein
MGLLRILRRQPKNKQSNSDQKELDELDIAISLLKKQVTELGGLIAREEWKVLGALGAETPVTKEAPKQKRVVTKNKFKVSTAKKELTDWFVRRNNKYLTKEQMQTMRTSPIKGIPNSTFYEVMKSFERDTSEKPIRYRLRTKQSAPSAIYGASLTVISQQLKGTKVPVTIHGNKCAHFKLKNDKWLTSNDYALLVGKIEKMFDLYGRGKAPLIQACFYCRRARRV